MMRIAALLVLVSLSLVAAVNQPYTHHAILDNIQAQTNSTAWGAALISFDRATGNLQYTLVNNVAGTTAAHIHMSSPVLASSNPIITLSGFSFGSNNNATGSATVPAAFFDALDNGTAYFNIHTSTWPGGEIRGQILAINQQVTSLSGAQEPAGSGVVTTATGVAFTTYNFNTNQIGIYLNHNVVNATLAHIHGCAPLGSNAGVIITIAGDTNAARTLPYVLTATLPSQYVDCLNNGTLYYNVHSTMYPGGEIRGQIVPIANYLADMNGFNSNQTTTALGVGVAALYGSNLWSAMWHTVTGVTLAHIHTGAPFVAGPITFAYSNVSVVPISQVFAPNATQQLDLQNGNDYFNIHTAAAPAGLIRGQIYAKKSDAVAATTTTTGGVSTTSGNTTSSTTGSSTSGSSSSSTGTTGSTGTGTGTTTTSSSSVLAVSAAFVLSVAALLA